MSNRLVRLEVHNFRSLAHVDVKSSELNVLFGPNGAGKSTFLDTLWFVRDCAIRGVDQASSNRSHGIGALWDGADEGANISIKFETELAEYEVLFGYSSGRIEPFVGELLRSKTLDIPLIDRKIGSDKADFYMYGPEQAIRVPLREPEKLALNRYLAFEERSLEAAQVDRLLHYVRFYHSREADLYSLKKRGSESSYQTNVWDRGQNLWSVLRNLSDRRSIDGRYDTIISLMRKSFPTFKDILIEQTGPETVYGNFVEKELREPIKASGVSDGHLQMLIHLTSLFSESKDRDSLILFDEPEISLHPHAISIFAEAVRLAVEEWNRQVFIATHSPVLLSQFDPVNILAAETGHSGETIMTRVDEIEGIKDLLEQYATGSLYMSEMIAAQSEPLLQGEEPG